MEDGVFTYILVPNKREGKVALVYFLCKNIKPPKKNHPLIPSNPSLKIEVLSSPLFENWVGGSIPLQQKGAGGAHYVIASNIRKEKISCQGGRQHTVSNEFLLLDSSPQFVYQRRNTLASFSLI